MKLSSLKKPEFWERHLSMTKKQFRGIFQNNCNTRPVFVLGNQRSGTTMLMDVFHRHPDMLVYDEHRNSPAFSNCRIRSADTIRSLLEHARFPAISFKPICDSHRFGELYREFPDGHFIWLYRDFKDVANSSLRKFDTPTRAVRLVCTGRPGGGWFQDGVSPRTQELLQQVYRPDLSEFDLACLAWGARNQLAIENGLAGRPGVTVLQYEALVSSPPLLLEWLFRRINVPYLEHVQRKVTARSIGRHSAPDMDTRVRDFCDSTLAELDRAFFGQHPPGARV